MHIEYFIIYLLLIGTFVKVTYNWTNGAVLCLLLSPIKWGDIINVMPISYMSQIGEFATVGEVIHREDLNLGV